MMTIYGFVFTLLIGTSEAFKSFSYRVRSSTKLRTLKLESAEDKYTVVPGLESGLIRPTITDKARTITHVCNSGTLCTTSVMDDVSGAPFGSYVDYILDDQGWPVLLLSEQSLHTVNIKHSPLVSLFCQLPRSQLGQTTAALSRVTIIGAVESAQVEELSSIKLAFTLVHPYAGIYNYVIALVILRFTLTNRYGLLLPLLHRTNRRLPQVPLLQDPAEQDILLWRVRCCRNMG